MTGNISIEVPTVDDWPDIAAVISAAFNSDPDEEADAVSRLVYEPERTLVARQHGQIVGTAGIFTRSMRVPGATVPTAHVTRVGVAPTARRQGIMTRLLTRQLADIRAAGEPIAALWASEGRLYQQFGYGLAVRRLSLEVNTREVRLPGPVTGRLRPATPADARDDLMKVYEAAFPDRPGWSQRPAAHWDVLLADVKADRQGSSALRVTLHEGESGVDGYVLWRTRSDWDATGPKGEIRVIELVAATTEAYLALWRFVLTLDLTRTTSAWICAVDEPLQYLVNEPRRLGARIGDALWVRVVNVPAALAARRYASDVDVVIEVTDPHLTANAGRWRLTGSPESAQCGPTSDPADLSCSVQVLGSIYLGGTALGELAAAGLVREHTPGTLRAASIAFGWHRPPSVIEMF